MVGLVVLLVLVGFVRLFELVGLVGGGWVVRVVEVVWLECTISIHTAGTVL